MALPIGPYQGQDLTNWQQGNKFLPRDYYSLNSSKAPLPTSETEPVTQTYGIPYTNTFTNAGGGGGGGGGGGSFEPYTAQSSGNFVTNRTNLGNTGYLAGTEPQETYRDKIGNIIKSGIGMAIPGANFLMGMAPSREKRLNATDNAFIDMQLGNQERSMHGGNLTNQDRYGFNKESMFGNYANKVKERADIARQKAKENIDDPNYVPRKIDQYYLEKEKEQEDVQKQIEFNDFIRQRHSANQLRKTGILEKKTQDPSYNVHGGGEDMSKGDGGGDTASKGSGAAAGTTGSWTPGGTYTAPTKQSPSDAPGTPFAHGGRIGYNRGRVVNPGGYQGDEFEDENTLEFMQDQGIPHSEMAETSPFEMRIQELMDEGMSWQEAYQIAAEEFGQIAEGEGDSFSEEGLASLV